MSTRIERFHAYRDIKKTCPNSLVLIESGVMLESFSVDANRVAEVLGIETELITDEPNTLTIAYVSFIRAGADTVLPMIHEAGYQTIICHVLIRGKSLWR